MSCDASGRGKFESGFLQASPHVPFSFADFTLNSFAIIDHSCGYDYMPSPMSPSSQSSNLEVILGSIKQKQKYYQNLVIKKTINIENLKTYILKS